MGKDIIAIGSGLFRPEDTRILYINGEITESLACLFNLTMLELEDEGNDDITVYINSPGGSVHAGLSMIDTMDIVRCDVQTVCVGMCASMAAWMLMCGSKGKRFALPHSKIILHQPLGGMNGFSQASDIKLMAEDLQRTKAELFSMVVQRTGKSMEVVERDCDRDFYLNADQALEYGIVDSVLRPHAQNY